MNLYDHSQNEIKVTSEFEETSLARSSQSASQRWWRWGRPLRQRLSLRRHTERRVEEHFIARLPHLSKVSFFLSVWLVFIILLTAGLLFQTRALTSYYTRVMPASGGIYVEGMVGQITNFNPIYASTEVDQAVSRLVFANLYYSDDRRLNSDNHLAESLMADHKAQQYTLTLKPHLTWHDGRPLTVDDVIFTIETIQNPAAQSPLRPNWQGVTLSKVSQRTVIFTLPASFSAFPANLDLGIIPKHILGDKEVPQLPNASFNHQPLVGSGIFKFDRLISLSNGGVDNKEFRIQLTKNPDYFQAPSSLVNGFHFWIVPTSKRLTDLFNQGQISGGYNLLPEDITLDETAYKSINLNMMNGVYLFFKNSSIFFNDLEARQAIISSLDVSQILATLHQPVQRIFGPLLPDHNGYGLGDKRPPVFNPQVARNKLQQLGWQLEGDGWYRDGQKLTLTLTTQKDTDYEALALVIRQQLARQKIGVVLDLRSPESIPLEILQNHNFGDMLIYGLNLGGDADVYSYWHSSQIDSNSTLRLNLAEYRSDAADAALEAGRSRSDEAIRRQRYLDFQEVWLTDLPALALYRLQFNYYTLKDVQGPVDNTLLIHENDRFLDVNQWAVSKKRVLITEEASARN